MCARLCRNGMLTVLVVLCGFWTSALSGQAQVVYQNPDTGYLAVIEDDAGLFTEEMQDNVLRKMKPVTEYGNAGVKTIRNNFYGNAVRYNEMYYDDLFGESADGCVFLIDMDTRELVLTSEGRVKKVVGKSIADSIVDNVYTYASKEQYDVCTRRVFSQVLDRLEGHRIAQPMKYICNALLAVIASILLNYSFWRILTSGFQKKKSAVSEKRFLNLRIRDVKVSDVKKEKRFWGEDKQDTSFYYTDDVRKTVQDQERSSQNSKSLSYSGSGHRSTSSYRGSTRSGSFGRSSYSHSSSYRSHSSSHHSSGSHRF